MVLTGSFALFPAIGLSCHRRLQDHRLTGLISASRYQNHTTSPSALTCSSCASRRPSHPAPNVRDHREAPLLVRRRTREEEPLICPTAQVHIFASRPNDQIHLNGFSNLRFWRIPSRWRRADQPPDPLNLLVLLAARRTRPHLDAVAIDPLAERGINSGFIATTCPPWAGIVSVFLGRRLYLVQGRKWTSSA
jgi:hypothetical protein